MVQEERKDDLYFGKYITPDDQSNEVSITMNESYVQRAIRRE